MRAIIILGIAAILVSSCTKKVDKPASFIVDAGIMYNILNEDGEDMLDTTSSEFFSFSDMKLYYLISNEYIEVYDADMDAPRNIRYYPEETPSLIHVDLLYFGDEDIIHMEDETKIGQSTALLELNESVTDTIVYEWSSSDKSLIVYKIWYNGDEYLAQGIFQVIK